MEDRGGRAVGGVPVVDPRASVVKKGLVALVVFALLVAWRRAHVAALARVEGGYATDTLIDSAGSGNDDTQMMAMAPPGLRAKAAAPALQVKAADGDEVPRAARGRRGREGSGVSRQESAARPREPDLRPS